MIWTALALYIFYLLFIVYAATAACWSKLKLQLKILLLPLALVAAALDVGVNLTLATVVFLRLPPCWLSWEDFRHPIRWSLTYRMSLYKGQGGWRAVIATWVCTYMLDPFQHGHCG
jgi:hypothetical protein